MRAIYHRIFVCILSILFFVPFSHIHADVTNNLSVSIAPNGDVPPITVTCTPGHAYTEALYNDTLSYMLGNWGISGGITRMYCQTGSITFAGWNMNLVLDAYAGIPDTWLQYVHNPFKYVVIDSTTEGGCYSTADCAQFGLTGAWEGYRYGIYLPSTTCYNTEYGENACTLAAGPVWETVPYTHVWTTTSNGGPEQRGYDSVLFLPGVEGSRLYTQTPDKCPLNCEDQLWEPNNNADATDLNMNTDGTSIKNVYTRDIINTSNIPINIGVGQNIYKSFNDMMDKMVAPTTSPKKMAAWKEYPYDWRYSVDDIVNNGTQTQNGSVSLIKTLSDLVASSTTGKVTIIAHSNGGLLAKALLVKLQEMKTSGTSDLIDHIDNLILVAVPQIGTASAAAGMLHGYDQQIVGGWFLDQSHARELGRNSPGAFGLLPSKEYINHLSASPIVFTDNSTPSGVTTPLIAAYGNIIDSYSEYKNFLFGAEGRVQPAITDIRSPITLTSTLFAKAETLHNTIDNWTPPANIHVVQIAGWGLDTVASFEYYPKYECNGTSGNIVGCKNNLDERPIFTADGDNKVVTPSALWMGGEKYYVNMFKYNIPRIIGLEHKDILEVTPLLNFISSIINGTNLIDSNYLSTSTPIDTTNRLHLSVLSPVSLDAYDSAGNHTGKICPPTTDLCYAEENIPNSSYYEFGEGKYLNLPQGSVQKVALQGTDAGTFTFNFQTVTPSGQATTSSFVDIPVTTQTQAEITVNSTTQVPQMKLDVTGDGTPDFTLTPNTTFDPITYLQIMRATIDSLDLTQAKINAFDKRVDTIIKLIQKGKIDKVNLRVDRFKSVLENKLSKPDPKKPRPKKLTKTDAQMLLDMLNTLLDNINQ